MSKLRKKPTGLNMGFENIVLLDESQREIDAPQVIKTPLGNYLVVYDKLDTVLLSPKIFGAWAERRGATGYGALDEDVEEVEDPLFCLRFASEILSTNADKTLGAPDVSGVYSGHQDAGDAEHVDVALPEEPVVPQEERVQTDGIPICEYTRATPVTQLLEQPLNLSPLFKGAGVMTAGHYHRYCLAVGRGLTVCNTVGHVHVSNDRSVFYQWDKGPASVIHGRSVLSFGLVRYPDQPKDPCAYNGIPLQTWVLPPELSVNAFNRGVLSRMSAEWTPDMQPVRDKFCEFAHEPVALVKTLDEKATQYIQSISDRLYTFGKVFRDPPDDSPHAPLTLKRAVDMRTRGLSIR